MPDRQLSLLPRVEGRRQFRDPQRRGSRARILRGGSSPAARGSGEGGRPGRNIGSFEASSRARQSTRFRFDAVPAAVLCLVEESVGALDDGFVGLAPGGGDHARREGDAVRSEEHTSELQSLMRISYAVFCLKKKKT